MTALLGEADLFIPRYECRSRSRQAISTAVYRDIALFRPHYWGAYSFVSTQIHLLLYTILVPITAVQTTAAAKSYLACHIIPRLHLAKYGDHLRVRVRVR